jgi:hypothetical protein
MRPRSSPRLASRTAFERPKRGLIKSRTPLVAGDRTGGRRSVTGAGNHVAEADPVGTVEFCELCLPDRVVVGRAGVHFDAGQQRRKLQVVQIS